MKFKSFLVKKYYNLLSLRDKCVYYTKRFFRMLKTWMKGFFADKKPDYSKIAKCKRLVVCAHPDDETIFFFSVLQKGAYVICLSNCAHKIRREEFFKALDYQGADGVMLNLPDVPGMKWMWSKLFLKRKFKKIKSILSEDCEIYTHSLMGEYGHPHHCAVGKFIKSYFENFNVNCTVENIEERREITEPDFEKKTYIMEEIYSSQSKTLARWCPWYDGYMRFDSFLK